MLSLTFTIDGYDLWVSITMYNSVKIPKKSREWLGGTPNYNMKLGENPTEPNVLVVPKVMVPHGFL